MNSISPIKFLTAVGFLLVTGFSAGGLAQANKDAPEETQDACNNSCEILKSTFEKECRPTTQQGPNYQSDLRTCTGDKIAECKSKNGCINKTTARERKTDCKSAMEKYDTAAEKAGDACESFEKVKTGVNSCETRIKACNEKFAKSTASGTGPDDLSKLMLGMYVQKNFPNADANNFPMDDNETTGPSCTSYKSKEDRKEEKNEQKDINKEISKLKEKIREEEKEKNKENAKLREKNGEIDIESQKVTEAVNKEADKLEKDKGDTLRKLNKELADSAIAIRKKNEEIIQEKEKVERIKFDNLQKMMQFTQDKISAQCNASVEIAKQCFVQSSKGQVSNDPKSPCANLVITAKGAKGTAQLKAKIAKVKEACFEQMNMNVSKIKFETAAVLRSSEMALLNKNNEIADAKNTIERRQNDNILITAETDKEKATAVEAAKNQMDNLTKKRESITKSTWEAVEHSNETIRLLTDEMNQLLVKQKAAQAGILSSKDLRSSISDAGQVIKARERARIKAIGVCCAEEKVDTKKIDPYSSYTAAQIKAMNADCGVLVQDSIYQDESKNKKSIEGNTK